DDKLKKIEARICDGIGFAEHQRLSAVHRDTDNLHLHIAINKIHPTKNTLFEPFQAYKTLASLCVELEKEHRLREENHQAHQSVSQGRVADMEHHSGTESLNHWLKRECLSELRAAATWQALHQVLSEHDLEIRPRANGLVIGSAATAWVKASTIARDIGKSQLEARLGPFVHKNAQINTPVKSHYEKRPIGFRKETAALYAQYQSEQQQLGAARRLAWQKLRYQKETHFAAAKRADKKQRSLIKVLGGGRFLQKILFAQAKESWKAQITELRQQNLHQRQQLAAQYPRLAWADWLKQQALRGNLQALELLRSREQAQGLLGDAIMAVKAGRKLETSSLPIDNITKQGTLILRTKVGAIRDDGDKLQVSTAAGDEV
ncbi:MAG: TraI/MobA(P) family conjugative relaxase, partial [Vibrionaceae bacterium]